MLITVYRILLIQLGLGFLSLHAAELSLRTLQLGGGEMPEMWVMDAKEEKPAKVPWLTSQPTQPMRVIQDGALKLFRLTVNAQGKPVIDNIQAVALPTGAKEILLLGQVNDGKASYVAIEDRFLNAKFNDWIAINTSSIPVAVRCGDKTNKPVRVDPGKSLIFTPKIEENKGVEMVAMAPRDGELKTFLSSYWPAFPGQRTMIIFYHDGEKMRGRRIGDRFVKLEEPKGPDLGAE